MAVREEGTDPVALVCEGCDRTETEDRALKRGWGRRYGPGDLVRWYCPDYMEGAHE